MSGNTIVLESSSVRDNTDFETFIFSNISFISTPTIIITIEATPAANTSIILQTTVINISVPTDFTPLAIVSKITSKQPAFSTIPAKA